MEIYKSFVSGRAYHPHIISIHEVLRSVLWKASHCRHANCNAQTSLAFHKAFLRQICNSDVLSIDERDRKN
jgi:hypothetical protein